MRKFSRDMAHRGSKTVWIGRAQRMDDVIRHAAESKSRVRVIVNDGDMRDANDPHAKASVVRGRLLDPVEWTIRAYDSKTGECLLVRGPQAVRAIDQFDAPMLGTMTPEQVDRHGKVFSRDPAVRRAVLNRAGGRCEFCLTPGFLTPSGEVFLETHHIVPLSKGGADVVENVAAICANHHREAHCGAAAEAIREHLLVVAAGA
jgi:5-methylcytosine-specific restriction enzyme A